MIPTSYPTVAQRLERFLAVPRAPWQVQQERKRLQNLRRLERAHLRNRGHFDHLLARWQARALRRQVLEGHPSSVGKKI